MEIWKRGGVQKSFCVFGESCKTEGLNEYLSRLHESSIDSIIEGYSIFNNCRIGTVET